MGRKRLRCNTSSYSPLAAASASASASSGRGMDNIIIDSGTTLTFLQEDFYNKLESTVSKAIKLKHINKLVTT